MCGVMCNGGFDTASIEEQDCKHFSFPHSIMPVKKKPVLRRRPPASAPKPAVRPDYEKKISQELPRFEKAITNLRNYGVSKAEMKRRIDAL